MIPPVWSSFCNWFVQGWSDWWVRALWKSPSPGMLAFLRQILHDQMHKDKAKDISCPKTSKTPRQNKCIDIVEYKKVHNLYFKYLLAIMPLLLPCHYIDISSSHRYNRNSWWKQEKHLAIVILPLAQWRCAIPGTPLVAKQFLSKQLSLGVSFCWEGGKDRCSGWQKS